MRARRLLLPALVGVLAGCSSEQPQERALASPSALQGGARTTPLQPSGPEVLPRVVADCEHFSVRPREIGVACGDGNYALEDAAYERWTGDGAEGRALAVRNTCDPSCAEGTFTSSPVSFRLDRLLEVYGVPVFSRLTVLDPATGQTLLVTPLLPMGCAVEPPSCPPSPVP